MRSDLHQPRPEHTAPRERSHALGPLAAALALGALALGALACLGALGPQGRVRGQDAGPERAAPPEGPRPCSIDGRASIPGLRVVRTARHGRPRVMSVDLDSRELRVEVITPSLFRVRTREGEPVVEGVARERPPISLRRDVSLPGLVALRGTPIVRVTPREDALDVDLDLGDGVIARRIVLGCDALRVRPLEAPTALAASPRTSPRWSSRGATLSIRDRAEEGIEVVRVAVPATFSLDELGRTEAFVHVRAALRWGRLDGWVRDAHLVPAR